MYIMHKYYLVSAHCSVYLEIGTVYKSSKKRSHFSIQLNLNNVDKWNGSVLQIIGDPKV